METTINRDPASPDVIISEAIALAEEKSWKKVTVRAISKRMGHQPTVLYQFFKNKDHLIKSILEKGFHMLNKSLTEARKRSRGAERKLMAIAVARYRFALDHGVLHSLMFSTNTPVWFQETVVDGLCQTKITVITLLQDISEREDECLDLLTNYISIYKGYTFFATELPTALAEEHFFQSETPEESLVLAMKRFLKSIRPE
jgi:AcrR family transcriptional regulator